MSGIPNGKALYEEYSNGSTEEKLAEKYKTTRSVIHGRLYRYKKRLSRRKEKPSGETDYEDEQVKSEYEKNTGWAYSKSRTIKTLDGLLKASETNLDIWEIERHVINKWDVTNKYGQVYTNWQVKAWFVRRKPIDVFPDINPVVIPLSTLKTPLRAKKIGSDNSYVINRVMFIPDPHFGFDKDPVTHALIPYHDESVLQIALDIFNSCEFDYLIWGGDVLDCNEWSTHYIKRPEFRQTTQPALNTAATWIASFIHAKPEIEHIVLAGNHDNRIEDYIISNLDEIYRLTPGDMQSVEPLMSISNLLGLKRMGARYEESFSVGDTRFIHGDIARKGGGSTARAHIENTLSNTVFAHVHRREIVTEIKYGFDSKTVEVFAMCPGCACYTDGRLPGSKEDNNWQNGIGILEFINGECISHEIVVIKNGLASYQGKIYTG